VGFDEGEEGIAPDEALFSELVRGVARERAALDRMIAEQLVDAWPLARIEKVMAATLRAGAFELTHRQEVPARVVINEYVDVAHAFVGGKEVGMVNGVLDRLAHILRRAEMGEVEGKG
jgi:N utilization substance protein B